MGRTLADASQGRANSTAFARFLLTSTVIYSHSFVLLWGRDRFEPIWMLTQRQATAGMLAVDGFLILSGFLVTRSWLSSKGATTFLLRRILRIYPAFLVAVTIGGLIAVPWLSPLAPPPGVRPLTFWGDLMWPALLMRFKPLWANGSLWILPFELSCYLGVALLGTFGALRRRRLILLLWIVNNGALLLHQKFGLLPGLSAPLVRIFSNYLAGMAFFLYRDRIRINRPLFVGAILALVFFGATAAPLGLLTYISPLAWGYVLLAACHHPVPRLQGFARHGDFSYGMYLYAYPIQLALILYFRAWLHPITLFLAAWPIAIGFGVMSWFAIEQPMLRFKPKSTRSEPIRPEPGPVGTGGELRSDAAVSILRGPSQVGAARGVASE
jgi:peptidoglycan/LPS O-acetylase OafA/YrhL